MEQLISKFRAWPGRGSGSLGDDKKIVLSKRVGDDLKLETKEEGKSRVDGIRAVLSWCLWKDPPQFTKENAIICATLSWCLQNDLSLLSHEPLNWDNLSDLLNRDRKYLIQQSPQLTNFPALISLINDPNTTIHLWTATLLHSLSETSYLLSHAHQAHTFDLLTSECNSLIKRITLHLNVSREHNVLGYNHSLSRKYTHGGRHVYESKWTPPKPTSRMYEMVYAGRTMVVLCSRLRRVRGIGVPSFRAANGRTLGFTLVSRSVRLHTVTYVPRFKKRLVPIASLVPLNTGLTDSFLVALRTTYEKTAVLKEFQLFSHLPIELRLKIYALCRLPPQIIRLHRKLRFKLSVPLLSPYSKTSDPFFHAAFSSSQFSSLLHTSHETRSFALKNWYPSATQPDPAPFFASPTYDWYHPGCCLCRSLGCRKCRGRMPHAFGSAVEKMILHSPPDTDTRRWLSPLSELIWSSGNVKEVKILHPDAPVLKMGTQVADLKVIEHTFEWQQDGESLVAFHAGEAEERNVRIVERHEEHVKKYERQKGQIRRILRGEMDVGDEGVEVPVRNAIRYWEEGRRLRVNYGLEVLKEEDAETYLVGCLVEPPELEGQIVKELEKCEVVELDAASENVGRVYGFLGKKFEGGNFTF